MLENLIATATELVGTYGSFGLFFLGIMEEIFLPVPSSLSLMVAGFLMLPTELGFFELMYRAFMHVAIPGALGLALGSIFLYYIGAKGGKPLIEKFGRFMGLSWESVLKMEERFKRTKRDEWTLFFLRAIPIVPNLAITAFCGFIRYPFKTFIILAFFGNIVRGFIMAIFGYYTGAAYRVYAKSISDVEHVLFGVVGIGLVLYLVFRFVRSRRRHRANEELHSL